MINERHNYDFQCSVLMQRLWSDLNLRGVANQVRLIPTCYMLWYFARSYLYLKSCRGVLWQLYCWELNIQKQNYVNIEQPAVSKNTNMKNVHLDKMLDSGLVFWWWQSCMFDLVGKNNTWKNNLHTISSYWLLGEDCSLHSLTCSHLIQKLKMPTLVFLGEKYSCLLACLVK